jgi:hypothetical protein
MVSSSASTSSWSCTNIYAHDLLLMVLHPVICGCNIFLVALHLLLPLSLFLWT